MDSSIWIPALIVLSLFLLSGLLSLGAALGNWAWFFGSKNARMLTARLSRAQARWLYGIIGLLILIMTGIIASDVVKELHLLSQP